MSIFMTLLIALKALNRNKMRTSLTMLGMIIGVGAVITMVALGNGAQAAIEDQIRGAGTNMIAIFPGNTQAGGVRLGDGSSARLMPADAEALRGLADVAYVSEGVQTRQQIIAANQNFNATVVGTSAGFGIVVAGPGHENFSRVTPGAGTAASGAKIKCKKSDSKKLSSKSSPPMRVIIAMPTASCAKPSTTPSRSWPRTIPTGCGTSPDRNCWKASGSSPSRNSGR
jgi:hypothetical protein